MVKKGTIFLLFFLLIGPALWAGGWNNTLMGCRAIAMGGAFSGLADDASAIFYNPAGLVFQENALNFSIDGFFIWPTHEYTMNSGKKIQSKYNNPLPQIFITYKTSSRITLGFGMYVPYAGGGVNWSSRLSGENLDTVRQLQPGYPLKSVLGIYSIVPTLSYQISDKLSIGINFIYYRGVLEVDTEVAPFGPINTEETGSAISAGFGLMFRPTEKLRLGMSVRGPARMRLAGITSFQQGIYKLNLDSETSFNLPWDVEVGLSYRLSENFLVATSAQYTMWSALDKLEKTIKAVPLMGDIKEDEIMNFKNIFIWRAGCEYVFPVGIALRAGFGLDRYASPADTLNIGNIDVDKISFLGGIGYKAGRMQIDAAYVYAIGKEREKRLAEDGLLFIEKYNLNVFILGLGVTYSF